jgi:hypothetical protein
METANFKNVAKAVELLCQAADEGCDAAASLLGKLCVTGKAPCTSAACAACKAVYAHLVVDRAAAGASGGVRSARERYTGNPIHHSDRWTDNQCYPED